MKADDEIRYDLHVHSTCSDGFFSPKELVMKAKELGLTGISITDHDTILAYNKSFFDYSYESGVDIIIGIEISTNFKDMSVHVLGFFPDCNFIDIIELCEKQQKSRKKRNYLIADKLASYGMPIDLESVYKIKCDGVGRVHIALEMVANGYVESMQDAFKLWIGDGKKCFISSDKPSTGESVDLIHKANGVAVISHPILIRKRSMLKQILEYEFDGMECFYSNFSAAQNNEMLSIANERNLICTGGSDFHGIHKKPQVNLGCSYTNKENMKKIKEKLNI